MPSKIGERISSALLDRRISQQDVSELISTAKAEKKFTPELKAELSALLTKHADKFDSAAKGSLEQFLATTTATRDLADPTVLSKHATSVAWNPVGSGGSLYVDGISYDDVVQGSIANCYMVSAFSAVAQQNPKAIQDAIKDNGDGTYDVRFFEKRGARYVPVTVKVDSDVPVEFGATPKYGKARDAKEAWVTVLEKAYAQWKGGYEAIGNGGNAGTVFEALTGKAPTWTSTSSSSPDRIFKQLSDAVAAHKPVTAGTHGKDSGVDYTGTGVYAWHAYTLLGTSQEAGVKYVQLRNPWGRTEPGADGKDDGIFKMKLDDFMKLYNSINIGG
ncbi:MAG: C2 family cysteine protease [Myxococcota bacterium]